MPTLRSIYNSRWLQLIILLLILLQAGFIYSRFKNLQMPNANTAPTRHLTAQNPSSWHLFGIYAASLDDLPRTSLPLTLEGTDISTATESNALISISNQKPKPFSLNDELMPGVTIHKLLPNRVILDDHGVLYQLPLPVPALQ